MNAKEISDATLESVTPADNDLILIYDTSEGTTGKATIAIIKNLLASDFVTKTELQIVQTEAFSDSITVDYKINVPFSITVNKPGYTPIASSILHSYSAQVLLGWESLHMESGYFSGSGFASRIIENGELTFKVKAVITWVKNF